TAADTPDPVLGRVELPRRRRPHTRAGGRGETMARRPLPPSRTRPVPAHRAARQLSRRRLGINTLVVPSPGAAGRTVEGEGGRAGIGTGPGAVEAPVRGAEVSVPAGIGRGDLGSVLGDGGAPGVR